MAAVWSLPFALFAIVSEPTEFKYHMHHFWFFISPVLIGFLINNNSKLYSVWLRSDLWWRIIFLNAAYIISSIITFALFISEIGSSGYYGGDGGGSYVLLLFPSVILYIIVGLLIGIGNSALKYLRG